MNQREDPGGERDRDRDAKPGGQGSDPARAGRAGPRLRAKTERGRSATPLVGFDFESVFGPQVRHRLRRLLRGSVP